MMKERTSNEKEIIWSRGQRDMYSIPWSLACRAFTNMPRYDLAWFNIKVIWDQLLENIREVTEDDLALRIH